MPRLLGGSSIAEQKSRFFIYRFLTYFSFLLIPVWVQKLANLNELAQIILIILYSAFMFGQWYLLGKEIDNRLKIYFRVHSSIDRLVYRILTGKLVIILLFNIYAILPPDILKHFFWGTWVVLGLFYSWPTRGKIIRESVSTQLGEFRFLDSFEKTLLGMIAVIFLFSTPVINIVDNLEAQKLIIDSGDKLTLELWNFITINYFPFAKFPKMYHLCVSLHFYFSFLLISLFVLYAFLRYFVSRRLSLLGVFAFISSWSFSKIIGASLASTVQSTFSLIWVWSLLWIPTSSTYRTGLFAGVTGILGTLINPNYFFLIPAHFFLMNYLIPEEKNTWFRKQVYRYAVFGVVVSAFIFLKYFDDISFFDRLDFQELKISFLNIFFRKAFYCLSLLGLIVVGYYYTLKKEKTFQDQQFNKKKFDTLISSLATMLFFAFVCEKGIFLDFNIMFLLVALSMLPLELIFYRVSRHRSRMNLIYGCYILICLLDSHFEGRVKILLKYLN